MPMIKTNRFSPSFTTIRLEVVWTASIAYKRSHNKVVAMLRKCLKPELKNSYKPSSSKECGHHATIIHCTIEETDPEGSWPDW